MEYLDVSNAVFSEQFKLESFKNLNLKFKYNFKKLKFKLFVSSVTRHDKSKKRTQTTRTNSKIKNMICEGRVKELELQSLKATTDRNYFSAFTRNGQDEK